MLKCFHIHKLQNYILLFITNSGEEKENNKEKLFPVSEHTAVFWKLVERTPYKVHIKKMWNFAYSESKNRNYSFEFNMWKLLS